MASETVERSAVRRWAWLLLQLLAALVLMAVSGWLAALVFPVIVPEAGTNPQGTVLTPVGLEAVEKTLRRQWWVSPFVYAVLCLLLFYFVPAAWRRWNGRPQVQPR